MPSRSAAVNAGFFQIALLFLAALSGCARQPNAVFTLSDGAQKLPELHQRNLEDGLRRIFGTPSQPRIAVPAPNTESVAEESSTTPEAAGGDAAAGPEGATTDFVGRRQLAHGAIVYRNRCSGCHGLTGNGLGDAAPYLQPKPRDYREGVFKFTSTPYGKKPTRQDLVRTIRRGAKGTSMPAFPWMSDEDIDAVIEYVIYLSQRGEVELQMVVMAEDEYDEDEELEFADFLDTLDTVRARWSEADAEAVLPVSARPPMDEASIEAGRKIFITENCWSCHGKDAKGQTEWLSQEFLQQQASAPPAQRIAINYDAWGHPAPAADLTARMLHGGRRPLDIYRRIYTGINGTPMPEFGQLFSSDPAKIWHLVHYVLFVVEGGDPTLGQPLKPPGPVTPSAAAGPAEPLVAPSASTAQPATDASDASPADAGPADAGPAADTSPADTSPADTSPAGENDRSPAPQVPQQESASSPSEQAADRPGNPPTSITPQEG